MHLTLYINGEPVKQWPLKMPAINWQLPIGPQRDQQEAYLAGAMAIARAETECLIMYEPFEFMLEAESRFPDVKESNPVYIWLNGDSNRFHLSIQKPLIELNTPMD